MATAISSSNEIENLIIICGIVTPIYVWRLREIIKIEKMFKGNLLEYSIIKS